MVVSHPLAVKHVSSGKLSDESFRGLYSLETYVPLLHRCVPSQIETLTSFERDIVRHGQTGHTWS